MATDLAAVGYKRRKRLFRVLALAYHKLTWALLPACLLVFVLAELLDCSTSIPVAKVLQKPVFTTKPSELIARQTCVTSYGFSSLRHGMPRHIHGPLSFLEGRSRNALSESYSYQGYHRDPSPEAHQERSSSVNGMQECSAVQVRQRDKVGMIDHRHAGTRSNGQHSSRQTDGAIREEFGSTRKPYLPFPATVSLESTIVGNILYIPIPRIANYVPLWAPF